MFNKIKVIIIPTHNKYIVASLQASTHGGCPVLVGSKWILNKWIYSFDQWKTYPCLLDRMAFTPPFSGYYQSR